MLSSRAVSTMFEAEALMAGLRRSSDCGSRRLFLLWRDDERSPAARAADTRDTASRLPDSPLGWVLAALEAYEHGLAPNAAMGRADAQAGSSSDARRAFLAFVARLAPDGAARSLPTRMRRHVLKMTRAAVLQVLALPFRLRQH